MPCTDARAAKSTDASDVQVNLLYDGSSMHLDQVSAMSAFAVLVPSRPQSAAYRFGRCRRLAVLLSKPPPPLDRYQSIMGLVSAFLHADFAEYVVRRVRTSVPIDAEFIYGRCFHD